jgi:hypothetical protein
MYLAMYLGPDLIASVQLNSHLLSEPGYIGLYKRHLKEQNPFNKQNPVNEPEFLLTDFDPITNRV